MTSRCRCPFDAILPAANTTLCIGVNQSVGGPPTPGGTIAAPCTPGQSIEVRVLGISKCIAGAAIAAAGTALTVNSSGQVVAAAAAGATSTYIVGIALTTSAASGDLISVLLLPGTSQIVNA